MERISHYVVVGCYALALLYAALAGLRTVSDFDIGWQMAAGRYLAETGRIPYADTFSYTARGREFIYPPFSGLLFWGLYRLGGFSALSWFGAAACAGTLALLLRGATPVGAALAIVAVPAIALRSTPRADLFSTVLFAAFFGLLWRYHRGCRTRLWPLPLLMLGWVNLHVGFVAGLMAVGAYVLLEALELPFAARRAAARARLRRAAPWLAASVAVTLVNPWGPRIYLALVRQERILASLADFVGYWQRTRLSAASLAQALSWRTPESGYWWLLAAALVAVAACLWGKQFGAALLLAAAAFFSLRYFRFQGYFAILAVVMAQGLGIGRIGTESAEDRVRSAVALALPLRLCGCLLLAAATLALVSVRVSDLVSNRYYFSSGHSSVFGPGASWWYPERAAAFLLRERLPRQLFNDYNLGGYLVWRLSPGGTR